MKKGRIIILSGPSGSGKTTLHEKLLSQKKFKNKIIKSLSTTTRKKRGHEKNGSDYFFISKKMFLCQKRAGHFLESQKVFDHYYGTPNKKTVDLLRQGKNVLLCIDVKGAKVASKRNPEALRIFIKAPSLKVLKKRLEARATEGDVALKTRLEVAKKELREAGNYDYVIVNDSLTRAYKELEKIVCKELGI